MKSRPGVGEELLTSQISRVTRKRKGQSRRKGDQGSQHRRRGRGVLQSEFSPPHADYCLIWSSSRTRWTSAAGGVSWGALGGATGGGDRRGVTGRRATGGCTCYGLRDSALPLASPPPPPVSALRHAHPRLGHPHRTLVSFTSPLHEGGPTKSGLIAKGSLAHSSYFRFPGAWHSEVYALVTLARVQTRISPPVRCV